MLGMPAAQSGERVQGQGGTRDRPALRARHARRRRACAAARPRRLPRWATRWRARARSARSPRRTPPRWAPRWRAPRGRRMQELGRAVGARRPSAAPTRRRRPRRRPPRAAPAARQRRAALRATRQAAMYRHRRMRPPRERTPRARRSVLRRLRCRSAPMRRAAQGLPALAGPAPTALHRRSPPGRARAGCAAGGGRQGRRWALPYPTPCSAWLS